MIFKSMQRDIGLMRTVLEDFDITGVDLEVAAEKLTELDMRLGQVYALLGALAEEEVKEDVGEVAEPVKSVLNWLKPKAN